MFFKTRTTIKITICFHQFANVLDGHFCADQHLGMSQNHVLFHLIFLHFCIKTIAYEKYVKWDFWSVQHSNAGQNIQQFTFPKIFPESRKTQLKFSPLLLVRQTLRLLLANPSCHWLTAAHFLSHHNPHFGRPLKKIIIRCCTLTSTNYAGKSCTWGHWF